MMKIVWKGNSMEIRIPQDEPSSQKTNESKSTPVYSASRIHFSTERRWWIRQCRWRWRWNVRSETCVKCIARSIGIFLARVYLSRWSPTFARNHRRSRIWRIFAILLIHFWSRCVRIRSHASPALLHSHSNTIQPIPISSPNPTTRMAPTSMTGISITSVYPVRNRTSP